MTTIFIIIIYLAFISLGLPDSLLGAGWPMMQKEFFVGTDYAGYVSMVITCGTIISSLFSAKAIKRFGTGNVTLVSVCLTAVALFGICKSPSYVWLIVCAIPLGLGAGAVDSALNEFVAEHYKAHHMNWLHCFWGIGAMTGPVIISSFMQKGESWRNGYFSVSVIQFALVAILLLSLPFWKRVESIGAKEEEYKSKGILGTFKLPGAKYAMLGFFCYCGIELSVSLWGSSFLVNVYGMDISQAALWVSMYFGGITAGRFISGFVSMKLNNRQLIRIGQGFIIAGVIILIVASVNQFLLVGLVLIGLGCAPIYPCMLYETPTRFGANHAQEIMGIQMACAYVGSTIVPPLIGAIASRTTFQAMPIAVLALTVLMIIVCERVNRVTDKKVSI